MGGSLPPFDSKRFTVFNQDPFHSFENNFKTVARTGLSMTLIMGLFSLLTVVAIVVGILYGIKMIVNSSPQPPAMAPAPQSQQLP